jgi:hypothetical protein
MANFFEKSTKKSDSIKSNDSSHLNQGVRLNDLNKEDYPYDSKTLGISPGSSEQATQMKVEEEEPLQAKQEEEEPLQGKFSDLDSQKNKENKTDTMPVELKNKMENSFGTNFSDLSIHTNSSAAKNIGALAYTKGSDVHFAPGQFNPSTQKGQELIGHELAHVVQQRQGGVKPTVQKKGIAVNNDKTLEKEADDVGAKASRGEKVNVSNQTNTSIQKKDKDDEKYSQVWAVGPYDAYKAKQDAETALAAARNSGLPGLHNGPADAYRHALWNFLMTQSIGEEQAKKVADIHEEYGSNPANEATMDYHNNHKGRKAGAKGGDANAKIMGLLNSGELLVIPDYDTDAKLAPVASNTVDLKGGAGKKGVKNYY